MPPRRKPSSPEPVHALTPRQHQRLIDPVLRLLTRCRQRAEEALGRELVQAYHAIGTCLLAAKLGQRADYGTATVPRVELDRTLVQHDRLVVWRLGEA